MGLFSSIGQGLSNLGSGALNAPGRLIGGILSPVGDLATGVLGAATAPLNTAGGVALAQGLTGGGGVASSMANFANSGNDTTNGANFNLNWEYVAWGVGGLIAILLGVMLFQSNNSQPKKRRRPRTQTARQKQLAALAKGRRTAARNRKKNKK